MTDTPRAVTDVELRDRFMSTCRAYVDYWASDLIDRDSVHDRLSGLLHSFLCILDGVNGGLPGFDLAASVHPADKDFRRALGENWIEPGMVINGCDMLHEILYDRGAWAAAPANCPPASAKTGADAGPAHS